MALHTAKNTEQSEFLLPLKEDDDSLLGDSDKAELTDKVETGHLVTELSRMNISEFSEEFLESLPMQTRRKIRWFQEQGASSEQLNLLIRRSLSGQLKKMLTEAESLTRFNVTPLEHVELFLQGPGIPARAIQMGSESNAPGELRKMVGVQKRVRNRQFSSFKTSGLNRLSSQKRPEAFDWKDCITWADLD